MMTLFAVNLLVLILALSLSVDAYELMFKPISVHCASANKSADCSLTAFRGTDEAGKCGAGELDTSGGRNEGLDWATDKLCLKLTCSGKPSNTATKIAIRLQHCELIEMKKNGLPMRRPTHQLIDENGCLANAVGPKMVPPLNYSRDDVSVEVHAWTFGNEDESAHFADEAKLSCDVHVCEDPCDPSCLEQITLDKCNGNEFAEQGNVTHLCSANHENGAVYQSSMNFYLMTVLLLLSCIILMFQ